jgi:chemotaxis protein MotB
MRRPKKPEEPKQGVPGYIVTFSDMITLLLTFFVLLLSMADKQVEHHKFMAGLAAFDRALADFGMAGVLVSSQNKADMDYRKPHYRVEEGNDEKEDRSIDAHTEMLRRILLDIEQMMNISPSHIVGMEKNFLQSGVVFAPGSSELDRSSKQKLAALAESIKINYSQHPPIVYVLGVAADEKTERGQWTCSVNRAQSVLDFLREQLPEDAVQSIFGWGAGNGGEWVDYSGKVSRKTHILIAVLNEHAPSE